MVRDQFFDFKEIDLATESIEKNRNPDFQSEHRCCPFDTFDQNLFEQAERLVFINRNQDIKFEIKPEKEKYLPREEVKLRIKATDQAGNPVQGRFSMAVTDEKLLTFADDKQGHLLASLLLEQEVKGKIEEPNFYFDEGAQSRPSHGLPAHDPGVASIYLDAGAKSSHELFPTPG